MGKLRQVKLGLAVSKPLLVRAVAVNEAERSRRRDAEDALRPNYKTARWQKLRWSVLVRDQFTCQMAGCGRVMSNTSLLVADHKVPAHIGAFDFFDEANLQCLCKDCHDGKKQSEERNRKAGGW
jgi:5-methylcytosine-specific restriction enzyme A